MPTNIIELPTSPIVCCCTTLKNATAYSSSQKLLNNACGKFIVVTKQEILVIYRTDFFDAASRRHNDVILLPATRSAECLVTTLFQQVHSARATVELLYVKKRQTFLLGVSQSHVMRSINVRYLLTYFLAPNLWPPNSRDLSPAVDS